jgi:hypothetical protein
MIISYALFLLTFTINTYAMVFHVDEFHPIYHTESEERSKAAIMKAHIPTSTEQIKALHKKIKNIKNKNNQ